ncbi:MAG: caspase family protein [Verrucomicrobiaceae bacterium]|nr:caspase family protein [Verrucomicrobiaceae bacterium]
MKGIPATPRVLIYLFTSMCAGALGQVPEREPSRTPTLTVEVGMHTAGITDVDTSADGSLILTCSDDKTARLWSVEDGTLRPLMVWRPPTAPGSEGMLYKAALSADGRLAAVTGSTGTTWRENHAVYLINTADGEVVKTLRITAAANVMKFSDRGSLLAVGLANGKLAVYDAGAMANVTSVEFKESIIYGLDWHQDRQIVVGTSKGKATILELSAEKKVTVGKTRLVSGDLSVPADRLMPPMRVAISPDGSRVAFAYGISFAVSVHQMSDLLPVSFPSCSGVSGSGVTYLAWNQDGTELAGGGHTDTEGHAPLRLWKNSGAEKPQDFETPITNGFLGLAHSQKLGFILVTGDPSLAALPPTEAAGRKVTTLLSPANANHLAMADGFGASADTGIVRFMDDGERSENRFFSVSSGTYLKPNEVDKLRVADTSSLNVKNWKWSTSPTLKGNPLPLEPGEKSFFLAINSDKKSFSMGTQRHVYCFTNTGTVRWKIQSHGYARAAVPSTDGALLAVVHGDGTIRWHLSKDGTELLAFFPHADRKRWIMWSPTGYFDCSAGAEDLIGWLRNRGVGESADFSPASRFRAVYYRPDVIHRLLVVRDVQKALSEANASLGKPDATLETAASVVERLSPPVVTLRSGGITRSLTLPVEAGSVTLRYSVRNTGPAIADRMELRFNGRPLLFNPPVPRDGEVAEITVPLPDHQTGWLSLLAHHASGVSAPAMIRILRERDQNTSAPPPTLHLLSVGVSKLKINQTLAKDPQGQISMDAFVARYGQDALHLADLEGAVADARKIANTFLAEKGRAYQDVRATLLADEEATSTAIRDKLQQLATEVMPQDILLFNFAGHGYADEKQPFLLATHDFDPKAPAETSLSGTQVGALLDAMPCRVVLVLDTCQSSSVLEDGSKKTITGPDDLTGLVNTLSSAERGIIVFSSAGATEMAFETEEGGYFTQAYSEGLRGAASREGLVTCTSLGQFISQRVPQMLKESPLDTGGSTQTPSLVFPLGVMDFPLAKPQPNHR